MKDYDEIIRSRKERDRLQSEIKNLEMQTIKERERYTSYPKTIESLERLSHAEIYEDDILAIDKILSMTGISHLYKDKHRYIQTLINDLQKYGNIKLAIKNLEKKINLNSKRKTRRHKQIKNKSTIKERPKKKLIIKY